ncbi:MAG: segregation/condensation protein A [Planctomycetota bacterium]
MTSPTAANPDEAPAETPAETPAEARTAARPDEFTVRLEEVFQGPLDLLLHLVKEQEVEIQDVKLANIAHSYMEHVRALEGLDIEVAGEYLVMAATLMAIKSRSLLPREEVELEDDLDPHDELIQRLIEYRRFKGASDDLEDRLQRRALEFPRGYRGEVRDNEPERTFELGEVTAWDLLATFSRLMRETLSGRTHKIKSDPRPLRWYVQTIGMRVRELSSRAGQSGATLRDIVDSLADVPSREGLVGAFCALLELMKIGLVSAKQESQEDDITLVWAAAPDQEGDLDDLIKASRFMDEDSEELDGALENGASASADAEILEPEGAGLEGAGPEDTESAAH